ncbi:unnamed protein product [Effrenium voratum]|uniref:DUF4116 domain-containing protein n=1 Tax=Effrenium voratum TaxID=2562239 RepID=A0AA36I276_9DINO|nr:unnamed protein product [Effrenium voratum]
MGCCESAEDPASLRDRMEVDVAFTKLDEVVFKMPDDRDAWLEDREELRALQFASQELRADLAAAAQAKEKQEWLGRVAENGFELEYAPEELRGDREFMLAAVAQSSLALADASQEPPGPSSGRARRG